MKHLDHFLSVTFFGQYTLSKRTSDRSVDLGCNCSANIVLSKGRPFHETYMLILFSRGEQCYHLSFIVIYAVYIVVEVRSDYRRF